MKKNKLTVLLIITIAIVLIAGISGTYAFFQQKEVGKEKVELVGGKISIDFVNGNNYINMENAYPVSEAKGKVYPYYVDFTIETTVATYPVKYEIQIVPNSNNTIDSKYIKVYLTDTNDNRIVSPKFYDDLDNATYNESGKTVYTNMNVESTSESFRLRVWIDESYTKNVEEEFGFNIYLYAENLTGKTLYEKAETSLASYLLADDGDARIVSGTADQVTNNYVWYSGKLWRIVALNNDGSIKLVTDENVTTIAWGADTTYEGSWMYQWLNEDFLDTLYNYKNLLVTDYKWNATETTATTKPAETTMVEGTVGLLNYYEYVQSYGSDYATGYLNNGYFWWQLTPSSSSYVRYVINDGSAHSSNLSTYLRGARPSVNLKSNIEISCTECDGSKAKPYRVVGDVDNPTTNELLNERVSGEYVAFDNELYRIVSNENNITKITKVDYLRDSSDAVITKYLASSITYGLSTNTQNDNYWDYYLNNTWYNNISTDYKNMLVSGTWYLGTVATDNSYKNAICVTSNTTETTKSCAKTSSVYNGYVGLGRIGEMFTSQLGEGWETSSSMWTITPYTSSSVRYVYAHGNGDYYYPGSGRYAAHPSVNLKSNIKITGGLGTKESPFTIAMR